jgi:hypothetical protein
LKTNEFVKIVKTFNISEFDNLAYTKVEADNYCRMKNKFSKVFNKYYYKAELDYE